LLVKINLSPPREPRDDARKNVGGSQLYKVMMIKVEDLLLLGRLRLLFRFRTLISAPASTFHQGKAKQNKKKKNV
jgi:hypothetical protein